MHLTDKVDADVSFAAGERISLSLALLDTMDDYAIDLVARRSSFRTRSTEIFRFRWKAETGNS